MYRPLYLTIIILTSGIIAGVAQADSLRCGTKLAQIGHTKADVIDICGSPTYTDSYCEPLTTNLQVQAQQQGDNNIQNNIAIQSCRNIDIWTYKPGSGQLTAHFYFTEGKLRKIERGERIP
jgi:hypothetical protein